MPEAQVELLPQRTNRRRPVMQWVAVDEPSGPTAGFLTLVNDRNTCVYRVEEFPADAGRGFCLLKLMDGSDATESHYSVSCTHGGRVLSCDCRGFTAHQHCRHADAVESLVENRWL